jgi:hypothetical protein
MMELELISVLSDVYLRVKEYHYEHQKSVALKIDDEWRDDQIRQDFWAIVSALRGPDSDDYHLKWLTTARVRAVIGVDPSSPIDVNTEPLTTNELDERRVMLRETFRHFTDHFVMAQAVIHKVYGVEI